MSNVIYFCCFGEQYRTMLAMSLASLRKYGGDHQEVVVIGDQDLSDADHLVRVDPPQTVDERFRFRMRCLDLFDFEKYDQVLYLDCDIIIKRDLKPLWDYEPGKLCLTNEPIALKDSIALMTDFLTPQQIDDRHGINSGTFRVNGSDIRPFFTQWSERCNELVQGTNIRGGMDQPVLNQLAFNGEIDYVTFPETTVGFPNFLTDENRYAGEHLMVHFVGHTNNTQRIIKRMKRYYRWLWWYKLMGKA